MKRSGFFAGALVGSALLAACGGNHTFSAPTSVLPPGATSQALPGAVAKERVLHSFEGAKDGSDPEGALLDESGTLYGTTFTGGGSTCANAGNPPGCGTIYKIDASGSGYQQLYALPANALHGALPGSGAMVDVAGSLYGTTQWGGSGLPCQANTGCGAVFKMAPSGRSYKVLHAFNGSDGYSIYPGVVAAGNMLYGATLGGGGGSCDCGFLYSLTMDGKEKPLHNFKGGSDGDILLYAPINVNGTLYGTTAAGGGGASCKGPFGYAGCGTIYSYDLSRHIYRKVYTFKGGKDGSAPINVIDVDGTLYGTTGAGGGGSCSGPSGLGCGTVFKFNFRTRRETVLYAFQGGTDGAAPNALVGVISHTLYGDTTVGGGTACNYASLPGCGVVFAVSTSGKGYSVIYRFHGGKDGANPVGSGPIAVNEKLYGATAAGGSTGCGGNGCGTVFAVTP